MSFEYDQSSLSEQRKRAAQDAIDAPQGGHLSDYVRDNAAERVAQLDRVLALVEAAKAWTKATMAEDAAQGPMERAANDATEVALADLEKHGDI